MERWFCFLECLSGYCGKCEKTWFSRFLSLISSSLTVRAVRKNDGEVQSRARGGCPKQGCAHLQQFSGTKTLLEGLAGERKVAGGRLAACSPRARLTRFDEAVLHAAVWSRTKIRGYGAV